MASTEARDPPGTFRPAPLVPAARPTAPKRYTRVHPPHSADKTHTQKGPILEATRKGHQRTSQHLPTTVPADQARISQVKITSPIPRSPPPSC